MATVPAVGGASDIWLRRTWLLGTIGLTLGITVVLIALGPASGTTSTGGLHALVVIGSSSHVAITAWFFTIPAVRAHARANPMRYIIVPIALVAGTALLAIAISPDRFAWFLVPYLAWQYFHYQKQNVGMAALAGASARAPSLALIERRAIVATGVAGIAGLLVRPQLLALIKTGSTRGTIQLLYQPIRYVYPVIVCAYVAAVAVGLWALSRRPRDQRPPAYTVMYVIALGFFAPVFLFHSYFSAALSFAIAHGFQYLLLVGLLAGSSALGRSRYLNLTMLLIIAIAGGLLLEHASLLGNNTLTARAIFGAYLGCVMSHFVIDAGLWRLRDEFPRQFLRANLPFLLTPTY